MIMPNDLPDIPIHQAQLIVRTVLLGIVDLEPLYYWEIFLCWLKGSSVAALSQPALIHYFWSQRKAEFLKRFSEKNLEEE